MTNYPAGSSDHKPYGKDAVSKVLIDSAATLIARRGVGGVTTRSIAKAAGVNHGLISRHFGGKESLVAEVARVIARRLFEHSKARHLSLATALDQGFADQSESIRALVRILLDTEEQHADLFDEEFYGEVFQWLRGQERVGASRDRETQAVRLYLSAVLVLGGEVVGPSIRRSLKLDAHAFEKVRRRAMKLMLTRM